MNALWELLAKMSSVGILNTDSHLGNYMITTQGGKRVTCKAIDFDPSLSTVFSAEELAGGDGSNLEKKEGWKSLYVLNCMLVMFTLAQDRSRIKLFELFKNAKRPAVVSTEIANKVETSRLCQFKDMVRETMQAIKSTRPEDLSVPQQLLALEWGGGYKGVGSSTLLKGTLRLPLAFFVDPSITAMLNEIAYVRNAYNVHAGSNIRPVPDVYKKQIELFGRDKKLGSQIIENQLRRELNDLIAAAKLPEIGQIQYDSTMEILMELDFNAEFASRAPSKTASVEAVATGDNAQKRAAEAQMQTHATQMKWAIRTNISWRGHMELAQIVHHHWTKRQQVVNSAVGRIESQTGDRIGEGGGRLLSSTSQVSLVQKMLYREANQFHLHNKVFENEYKRFFKPIMFHVTRDRPPGFTLLEFLYEYIYADGSNNLEISQQSLSPEAPDTTTTTTQPQVYLPDFAREILAIKPSVEE